jgi:3-oxoacyl-[acyl-carrier protein] reductase/7-alpha-hydroxysteroid dehydrogenase
MLSRFIDKICLITGGTRGIGLATAKRFLSEGAQAVIICSSKQETVQSGLDSFPPEEKRIFGL